MIFLDVFVFADAALAWMVKDGVGMLASIAFASSCSTFFGLYMKEW